MVVLQVLLRLTALQQYVSHKAHMLGNRRIGSKVQLDCLFTVETGLGNGHWVQTVTDTAEQG